MFLSRIPFWKWLGLVIVFNATFNNISVISWQPFWKWKLPQPQHSLKIGHSNNSTTISINQISHLISDTFLSYTIKVPSMWYLPYRIYSNAKQFIYGTESADLSCVTFDQWWYYFIANFYKRTNVKSSFKTSINFRISICNLKLKFDRSILSKVAILNSSII